MIYRDPVTRKPIDYSETSVFIIFIRGRYHKKRAIKYFAYTNIQDALDFYYQYEIPETYYKYLHLNTKDDLSERGGEVIFKMKGHLPSTKELKLKLAKRSVAYEKVPTLNLIHTPMSLAKKLKIYDFSRLPVVHEAWTKTRLVYCLMSYFFSLSHDEQSKLMEIAYPLYLSEKLMSGGRIDESNKMVEIVSNEIDLNLL